MKVTFSASAAAGAGALLCALFLAGCSRPSAPAPAPVEPGPGGGIARLSSLGSGSDPLAAAKSPGAAAAAQARAAQDIEDNARARGLAAELGAHPDWLVRQAALCGPGDAALQARFAALQGPPAPDLRDFKVACIAKDITERRGAWGGGVKNTGSL